MFGPFCFGSIDGVILSCGLTSFSSSERDIQEPTDEEPVMETDMDSGPNEPEEIEQPDSETTEESPVEDESSDEQEEVHVVKIIG